jgi:S-adenosylmethionine synthetase
MIRTSEAVLPGHPDRFSDQVADAIVQACYQADPRAYCQVEVGVWSDQVYLTGGLATREPLGESLQAIVHRVGEQVGYLPGSALDASRYTVHSSVMELREDPRTWSDRVNDQCIATGYAGYDALTHYLPPEHFLVQSLTAAVAESCRAGALQHEGPDGKLLVRLRESSETWALEQVLITLQQRPSTPFATLAARIGAVLREAYAALRRRDRRWVVAADEVALLINPNGPLLNGGSDGDNGQTGRKLVVDHYGPRVPIGGGALAGKDFAHIDRAAAYAARHAAVHAVTSGARECRVTLAYAPNRNEPLEVHYDMEGRGERRAPDWFAHSAIRARYPGALWTPALARGRHFMEPELPWNRGG